MSPERNETVHWNAISKDVAMRKYLMGSAAMLIVAMCGVAQAGTYTPVPMVPGAVSEIVFSINNHNVVAGSFRDSANVEHGFFGPLDGSNWTTFDAPFEGTTGTEPRYIGDDGAITGIALNPKFKVGEEFYRAPDGTFSLFEKDGLALDGVAQGQNASGASVGDYVNNDGKTIGYAGQSGSYSKDFRLHLHGKFPQISPRGLSDLDNFFVGWFIDQTRTQRAFYQEHVGKGDNRTFVVDYPGSNGTGFQDVNQNLTISGQWTDAVGNLHAFTFGLGRKQRGLIDLNPGDGSQDQQAWGINDHGLVAISTSTGQSYIYCPKKRPEKCPNGGLAVRHHTIVVAANGRQ